MRILGPVCLFLLAPLLAAQEIPLQKFQSSTPQIDLRVYVDIAVDFYIQGDRVRYDAGGTKAPRNDGSAYSAPLPFAAPSQLSVKKMDGRGDIVVIEEPSLSNGWTLKLRISDSKGGEDRYHARITWDGTSSGGGPGPIYGGNYVQISELSATASGTGAARLPARTQGLTQTSVSLTTTGLAIVSFSDSPELRFKGSWRQNGGIIELTLNDVLGTGAGSGSGRIQLSGDRLATMELNGSTPNQGSFQLNFTQRGEYRDFTKPGSPSTPVTPTAPAPPPLSKKGQIISPNPPSIGGTPVTSGDLSGLSQTLRGTGYLEPLNGSEEVVREILVRLDQGGRARFELSGDRSWSILGTWRKVAEDRVEVQIEQLNSAPGAGNGTLLLRVSGNSQPQIRQIEMNVTASRVGALDLRFTGR
ncbi:MAG: hypothetical protein GC160_22145 [Acidobacteria bacterium]|nr:hypothetical protein [Acidobacteriota bacterium]